MPVLLGRIQAQNESWLQKLPPRNTRFRGVLFPVSPTQLPTSVFIAPRIGLRCRLHEPVAPGDLARDAAGRVLLVGYHDDTISGAQPFSKTFALFQMTQLVSWARRSETVDPVTQQPVALGAPAELGPVWISLESYTHGDEDPGLRITTDRLRAITAAPLQLGDLIGDKTVRRINRTLGITVAEIQ